MLEPRQQFRVLHRHFLLRMVDLEVLAAGGDVQKLLGQFGALLAAFSFVVAIYILPPYVATTLRPDQVALAAWGDQEFLISTTMAVVGVFAVIAWDAVFPDRRDSLILGMLPVATRTIFRAKVAALGTALAISVVAVNLATGISYPFVAVNIPRAFLAYWTVMTLAGLFMFCSLLALQGLAAQIFSYRVFLRISSLLQLAAFFAILGVYFLTPGPTDMSRSDPDSQRLIARLPSFWFLAMLQRLNGVTDPVFAPLATRALWGLLIAITVAAATYGLAYYRNIHRIIEQPDISPGDRSRPASRILRFVAQRLLSRPLERALLLFIARTLARSRQHRVILAAFGGIGLAISLTFARSLLFGDLQMTALARRFGFTRPHWYEPNVPFMAAGFVMLFFVVIGTRAVFSLPATLKANWIFRITAVHSPRAYFAATRKSMFVLAAGPVWIAAAILYIAIWPRTTAFAHVLVMILVGIILIERSLVEFRKVPFACSYMPGKSNLRLKLGGYGLGFLFAVYLGASAENSMLETKARGALLMIALGAFAIHARHRWAEFAASPRERLQFEDTETAEVSPLNLHDAGAYSSEERYIDVLDVPQRAKTFSWKIASVALVVIVTGVSYEQISERLHPRPPQIGRSVDIGGRSLNIFCSGQGGPSVVFESGAGGPGYAWVYVQGEVAKFAQACWYDRAGYGWSDSGPYPRDSAAVAEDLHRLLRKAEVPPPYVLVGASFGGLNVRVYNRHFPEDVAGMVLVDSSHDDERQAITPQPGGGWLPYFPHAMSILARVLKQIGVLRLVMEGPERDYVPKGLSREQYRLVGSFEPRTLAENGKELGYESRLEARAAGGLGDRPLIVLTAGLPRPTDNLGDAWQSRRYQEEWIKIQGQLAWLSTRGKQIVIRDSHHAIQFDRPDAVIDAVHEVVEDVRISQRSISMSKTHALVTPAMNEKRNPGTIQ